MLSLPRAVSRAWRSCTKLHTDTVTLCYIRTRYVTLQTVRYACIKQPSLLQLYNKRKARAA